MTFLASIESAASYLNVSERFVQELIDSGLIESVGDDFVTLRSLNVYKWQDDAERQAAADELTRLSQEMDIS